MRKIIYIFLALFILADVGYSYLQHLAQPLDGDVAWNLVPNYDVKPVLEDPFGFKVIANDTTTINPNRFFCHWGFRKYLLYTPIFLHSYFNPIDSVYHASAISKILIQIALLILLAIAATGSFNAFKRDFILALFLMIPLFQTNGYRSYMGIIDPSITYTFFYALPLLILLLFFLPFFLWFYHGFKINKVVLGVGMLPLAVIIALSGPLNPGIVLVLSLMLFTQSFLSSFFSQGQGNFHNRILEALRSIPSFLWFYFLPISILSCYSLYLGTYNSITISTQIPLSEMYARLPQGIYYQVTQKLGFPVLFAILFINYILIKKYFKNHGGEKVIAIFKWVGIFSLLYVLLLPLGGYREYRPNILRYDTIMPITVSLIFIYALSSLFLLKNLSTGRLKWYLPLLVLTLFVYTLADEPEFHKNTCERESLRQISVSNEKVVPLNSDCPVMSWEQTAKPEDSELNATLLQLWGITERKTLFFNKLNN